MNFLKIIHSSYQVYVYMYVKEFRYMIVSVIIEIIRKHIKTCGKTRYQISKETGVNEDQLCRIMQGKTCTVETADILLNQFGLELVSEKAKEGEKEAEIMKRPPHG
jgi:hypothetical protein